MLKLVLEIVLAVILHPVAFLLMVLNLSGRSDLPPAEKIIWAVVGLFWGVGPILYILVGSGSLW